MAGQTEQVLRDIDGGALNPGDVLEQTLLMAQHGVSRIPVREAFLQLETAGLTLARRGGEAEAAMTAICSLAR